MTEPTLFQGSAEPLAAPATGDHAIRDLVDVAMVLGRLEDIAKLLEGRIAGATSSFAGASPLPLLDVTRDRATCEFYHLETVRTRDERQQLAAVFATEAGSNALKPASATSDASAVEPAPR